MSKPITKKKLQKMHDWGGRKYRTAWLLTVLFTCLFVIPGVTSLLLTLCWESINFILLPVEFYVPLIGVIWGAYFGANLAEKLKPFQPKKSPPADFLDGIVENTERDNGGQPEDSNNP